jgi:MFS family permease
MAIGASFVVLGIFQSAWAAGLAQLKYVERLSAGVLGSILTISSLVSIPPQFASGRLIHHFGRSIFVVTCLVMAVSDIGTATFHSHDLLLLPFILSRGGFGIYNCCINTSALHHEHVTGRRNLPTLHALYSVGGAVGAAFTALLLSRNVSLLVLYAWPAAIVAVAGWELRNLVREVADDGSDDASPPKIFDREVAGDRGLKRITPLSMIATLGEVILYTWPAIYMRDYLHTSATVGAMATFTCYAAMTVGRFGAGPLQKRKGRLLILQLSGVLIAAGMAVTLATRSTPLTLIGLAITGLGYSACYPTMLSVAGSLVPGRPAAVSSFVQPLGAVAAILAPALVGNIAEVANLRIALALEVIIGVTIAVGIARFRHTAHAAMITD